MKPFGSLNRMPAPIWIVIPTYWGDADDGIYDHPTPLDGTSTLPFLLDSLLKQDAPFDFETLILVSTTSPKYENAATARVQQTLLPYRKKLNLHIADVEAAQFLHQELQSHSLNLGIVTMRSYAAVRNMQLLVPALMSAEIIIAIDDDEIVPTNYLKQAVKWIGKNYEGEKITGIAGPYHNEDGSPYITEVEKVRNILVDKSVFMNQTMRQLMEHPADLTKTPMALGGNMVFHRDLFTQVGFDPAITRGEDIDYLINARIAGRSFYFDSKLTITHLPPRQFEAPKYAKMRQDVIRFIYEREKIRSHNISAKELLPYPGKLLEKNFIPAALEALCSSATPEMIKKNGSPEEIVTEAQVYAKKHTQRYEMFSTKWKKSMKILEHKSITLIDRIKY